MLIPAQQFQMARAIVGYNTVVIIPTLSCHKINKN